MIRKLSFFSIIVGLLLPVGELQAGSASTPILFSAFFYGGSCEVIVPLTVTYNNGAPLPDTTIPNNQQSSQFPLILSGCQAIFWRQEFPSKGTRSSQITMSSSMLMPPVQQKAMVFGYPLPEIRFLIKMTIQRNLGMRLLPSKHGHLVEPAMRRD